VSTFSSSEIFWREKYFGGSERRIKSTITHFIVSMKRLQPKQLSAAFYSGFNHSLKICLKWTAERGTSARQDKQTAGEGTIDILLSVEGTHRDGAGW
jgi:hypothetical protein